MSERTLPSVEAVDPRRGHLAVVVTAHCGLCHNEEKFNGESASWRISPVLGKAGWWYCHTHGWLCPGCRVFWGSLPRRRARR